MKLKVASLLKVFSLISRLNDVLRSLGKIQILPVLQLNAEAHRFSGFDVFEETELEGHHYKYNPPLDSSSENRTADFGTGVFKLSEEDGKFEFKLYPIFTKPI